MKREYELMLVMNPALSKEDSLGAKDRVKDIIGEEGGEITSEDDWGTRRLAYPIKKAGKPYMEGNYQILRFNMEAHDVSELENQIRLSENVLRHMVVRDPPPNKKTAKTDVKNEENIDNIGLCNLLVPLHHPVNHMRYSFLQYNYLKQ